MPIYEYECRSCGHGFEQLQKVSEPVLTDCPECANPTLKKLISPVAFRLKGTGWYETDFKNNRTSEKASAQSSENGSDSTEDGKPENDSISEANKDSPKESAEARSQTAESKAE